MYRISWVYVTNENSAYKQVLPPDDHRTCACVTCTHNPPVDWLSIYEFCPNCRGWRFKSAYAIDWSHPIIEQRKGDWDD